MSLCQSQPDRLVVEGNRLKLTTPASGVVPAASEEPIFHQPWWLDAVVPGRWEAVTVERGGRGGPDAVRGARP
jgi:hypothetical protein